MLRIQSAASRHGVFLEGGSNDVAYSAQRADEVAIRIAETERAIASFTAAAAEARARLQAEEHRVALLREAELVAPSGGMIWKLGASDGERLAVGDMGAQIVDCRSAFILAAVPQDRFSDVEINGIAKFRLSGEKTDRTGRVVSVTGDASVAADRNLAAAPLVEHGASATAIARIEFEAPSNTKGACLVGRTARVLLPAAADSGFFARLARRLF
jgi:multidrug resistance efflux pump